MITYLLFKLALEWIITFFASVVFSCAVFFPLKLRGDLVYFWLNYLATLSTGIGKPTPASSSGVDILLDS